MPKARISKVGLCVLWAGAAVPALAQPVLGQYIEQTKKNKLNDLLQPKVSEALTAPGAQTAKAVSIPVSKGTTDLPVLWSLSGINSQLVAEIWENQGISRVAAVAGQQLPNGWTVAVASSQSLTILKGKKTHTLYPAAPGSTGAEFTQLKKSQQGLDSILASLAPEAREAGAGPFPVSVPAATPMAPPAAPGPQALDAALQAAGNLPLATK